METKANQKKTATAVCTTDPRVSLMPACEPPKALLAEMAAAGADKEELEGEDLRIVRIDNVESAAWQLYATWACSLGDVGPTVLVGFGPEPGIAGSCLCPPRVVVGDLMNEANSIVNLIAPLSIDDFLDAGVPALAGPLVGPTGMATIHAKVAVTALVQVLSDPGVNFPAINALHDGQYVCHILYKWLGAAVTVQVFRS